MILGTHNSGTGGRLLWWLRPLAWLINPTSKCQDRTISEQLEDGVRLFNLQVTKYKGEWVFSHGLAIYNEELYSTLSLMQAYASKENPIYFTLYLDDNLLLGQPCEEFRRLVSELKDELKGEPIKLLYAWIEGGQEYPYVCKDADLPTCEEHYWSLGWAKANAKSWLDWLPLPKRHAKMYNKKYKSECKQEFLMLDFYNYG